ncbi:hypothetical protein CFC21_054548 [Triticum aestivum]|uniref:Uncharacterized protein n=2 Tax=Triticum aestivum TaxID=4565 RepID=A0A9R1GEV0_WHEAT|nr:hypothetical protein CFC21_054548 [Triticum aestivum]
MSTLRTLRARPQRGFPLICLTYDYMEHMVKFSGRTVGLKRSQEKEDYFDIEFETQREASYVFYVLNGKVPLMEFSWAPRNLTSKKPPSVEVSFIPPTYDLDAYSETPSLPIPANQPFPTVWKIPTQNDPLAQPDQLPAMRYPPSRVQMDQVDPRPPYEARFWPQVLPTY